MRETYFLVILLKCSLICKISFDYRRRNNEKRSLTFSSNTESNENANIEGYYWREYRGFVPEDALPGGRDTDKRTTYIAQILHDKLLIPGEIRDNEKRAYYEWGFQEFAATENIKILCTRQPEKMQWFRTTKDNFTMLTNRNFVFGGYEPNNEIYVGRKVFDESIVVGKVQVILPSREAVFHYPRNKMGHFDYDFEILKYDKVRLLGQYQQRPRQSREPC
ncbi:hypothetical protein ILUMI_27060 [Ignelater luminosus]|uniref:Uncharacterized protein n=1 Tax=Ignelater luminosus TaxID=2038154 RepID=A0A8K0C7A0_IGNLU|nr:hypothetical protein ILUMI_27060 [Ignelater luminosus]